MTAKKLLGGIEMKPADIATLEELDKIIDAMTTNTPTDELAPCPFCGATCIVTTANENDFAAACGFCRTFGPRNVSRTEAIAAWNTRHPPHSDDALREAAGLMWETLTYISAASDCMESRAAAKEIMEKAEPALAPKGDV